MNSTEVKPLHPLSHGNILIVRAKASNFDDELKSHPRVTIWDSQNEHWLTKELPSNTVAVFITRFIGHNAFKNIQSQTRKRHLTIFNPEGTGLIARQVKELLNMNIPPVTPVESWGVKPQKKSGYNKLHPLHQFIDFTKNNKENAEVLMVKAKELGITTTLDSLANSVGTQRRKKVGYTRAVTVVQPIKTRTHTPLDVSVQILDNIVKEIQDMRDYLIAVTKENHSLKSRIDKFKKALDNDRHHP